jgi:hypothetical protein
MKKPITIVTLPAWTYEGADKGLYTLAAALTLAGLENRWVKLSAAQQRAILGEVRFGKHSVGIFDGVIKGSYSCAFGTDREVYLVTPFIAAPMGQRS